MITIFVHRLNYNKMTNYNNWTKNNYKIVKIPQILLIRKTLIKIKYYNKIKTMMINARVFLNQMRVTWCLTSRILRVIKMIMLSNSMKTKT